MKKYSLLAILLLHFFCGSLLAQSTTVFVHHPEISHDAQTLAFTFQGDIWQMDIQTGKTTRLTIHETYESMARWSPDDSHIAFTGERYGNPDVFVIPAQGGISRRLTYHSAGDYTCGWLNNEYVLFETERIYNRVERETEIHQVSTSGNTPERVLNAFGFDATASPNGKYIAFTNGSCRVAREAYDGPANRDIWVFNTETEEYSQITTDTHNDFHPRWVGNDQLYFLSGRSGRYNVHSININSDGSKSGIPVQITKETKHGLRYFSVDASGEVVYYASQDKIIRFSDGVKQEVTIELAGDYRFDPITRKTMSDDISEYRISPDGEKTAFIARGEVFVKLNNKDVKQTKRISNTPARERSIAWLNDTTLLYISDRDGQNEIYLARSGNSGQTDLFKTLKYEEFRLTNTDVDEFDLEVGPKGEKLAYRQGRGKLVVTNISASGVLSNSITLLDGWDTPGGIAWSPDGEWLAYNLSDLNFNEEIYIHKADNTMEPVNISLHPKYDYGPVWSRDGKKLAFVSQRNNGDGDIWFVWLTKEDAQKSMEDWKEEELFEEEKPEEQEPGDKKKGKQSDKTEDEKLKIDFEDIHERLVQVTALPGTEDEVAISKDGKHFYFTAFQGWRQSYDNVEVDLYKIKWDGKDLKRLTEKGKEPTAVTMGPKGDYVYYLDGKKKALTRIRTKDDKAEPQPFTAKLTIDHRAEKEQILEQVWRDLNAGFYDPQFHGHDWNALKATYKPWALNTSTYQDFRNIMNWMLGQLNASHMGVYRGETPEDPQRERTGLLGLEVKNHEDGVVVTYVLPESPADHLNSKFKPGDVIKEVNGQSISGRNFYELLVNSAGEKQVFTVLSDGKTKEIVLRPVDNLSQARYLDWVKSRRSLVEEWSQGRLGYLHIQGMNWTSFERFERELTAAGLGKEGIVIDVRYNGGGWTTDYLMAVLNVRQHAYTVPRGAAENLEIENKRFKDTYPFGERLPLAAWTKPSIALCNSTSYSNAEIFSHAYKTLDIGTLVGQPTFGAVISTGASSLINGGIVRMPFRAWYVKATEENMENGPAVPDVIVKNPVDYRTSTDEQLKRAVQQLLTELKN